MKVARCLSMVVLITFSAEGPVSRSVASAQTLVETRQSAEEGDSDAQYALGLMYVRGDGVPQDDAQALAWLRKAAEQGDVRAQNNVGFMHATGRGVPRDNVEAYKWLTLAASRVTGEDKPRFEEARDTLAKQMTPAQLAEAQRLAGEWQAAFEQRQQ